MYVSKPTAKEYEERPHVILTNRDTEWDPHNPDFGKQEYTRGIGLLLKSKLDTTNEPTNVDSKFRKQSLMPLELMRNMEMTDGQQL
jgi:hypothetical protein